MILIYLEFFFIIWWLSFSFTFLLLTLINIEYKFIKEITLLGQPFVKNPDQTIAALLKDKKANVTAFVRFEVGEGIEKKTSDFVNEVMSQVNA